MTIIRTLHNRENPYVMINKKATEDSNLSLRALGLWVKCIAKPDNWTFRIDKMIAESKEGRDAVKNTIKELIENGYCFKVQTTERDESGKILFGKTEYVILEFKANKEEVEILKKQFEEALAEEGKGVVKKNVPFTDIPLTEVSATEKRPLIINNDKQVIKEQLPDQQNDPPEPQSKVESKKVVVVPSLCLELGATEDSYRRLLKLFPEKQILKACEVAKSQDTIPENFFGWIRDCITYEWEPKASGEEQEAHNKKILHECFGQLDGKERWGRKITIGPNYIEFLIGGVHNKMEIFKTNEDSFEFRVRKHIKMLQDGHNCA